MMVSVFRYLAGNTNGSRVWFHCPSLFLLRDEQTAFRRRRAEIMSVNDAGSVFDRLFRQWTGQQIVISIQSMKVADLTDRPRASTHRPCKGLPD